MSSKPDEGTRCTVTPSTATSAPCAAAASFFFTEGASRVFMALAFRLATVARDGNGILSTYGQSLRILGWRVGTPTAHRGTLAPPTV